MQKNCEQCGNSFEAQRSTARFCGVYCRQLAHRQAKRAFRASQTKNCVYCGKPFHFTRNTAKYCSNTCRQNQFQQDKKTCDWVTSSTIEANQFSADVEERLKQNKLRQQEQERQFNELLARARARIEQISV